MEIFLYCTEIWTTDGLLGLYELTNDATWGAKFNFATEEERKSMSNRHYQEFIDKVLDRFAADISNRVFLMIQGDKELMREYLRFVTNGTDPNNLDCELSKRIRMRFNLKNSDRCKEPENVLTDPYEQHETK